MFSVSRRSLRPLDDCFLKPLVRPLETFKKVVRKIKANPFERFCRSLDFFAYTFKPLANPLRALEKPLTSRSLAVSFYPLNGKPLVYVFLEKVTNTCTFNNNKLTCLKSLRKTLQRLQELLHVYLHRFMRKWKLLPSIPGCGLYFPPRRASEIPMGGGEEAISKGVGSDSQGLFFQGL